MATCAKCGNKIDEGQRFCRFCGTRVEGAAAQQPARPSRTGVSDEDLALFVGKNAEKYLSRFQRFSAGGGDAYAVAWHWPAFFFAFWWMLYRKMYGWAVLVLFLGCVPYLGLVLMIVFGMSANYLYYRHAKRKVLEIRSGPGADVEMAAALARAGGVNNVAVVVAPLLLIVVVAILAAIAIPQFALYRQKAFEVKAKQQIREACSAGEAFFAAHPERAEVEPEDLLAGGLVHTADVELLLLDGRREFFSISARHEKGKKTYYTDRQCALTEEEAATADAGAPR